MTSVGTFRVCKSVRFPIREAFAEAIALPSVLTTMLRSLIETWPDAVYEQPLVTTRFLGRRTTYVCDPRHIHSLLVDHAGALEREPFMLRALGPALGSGILTADGAHWREQRRTSAPMFRPDRVRGFVSVIAGAAQATRDRWLREGLAGREQDILRFKASEPARCSCGPTCGHADDRVVQRMSACCPGSHRRACATGLTAQVRSRLR